MTYYRRRKKRISSDVVDGALRTLHVGQELVCTVSGYTRILGKINAFRKNRQDVTIAIIASGSVRTIRRIA